MRFLVKLKPLGEEPTYVPIDYRGRFISLLKLVFGEGEFEQKGPRPYTFAVYFGKGAKINKEYVGNVQQINFRFSTGDMLKAVNFYNGMLKLKKEGYEHPIGNCKFRIEWISQEKEKTPTGIFRTLSPVVVERIGFISKDPNERYVLPLEDDFNESLLENILRRYKEIFGNLPNITVFKFTPINVKGEFIRHYGGFLRGFLGKFKIESDSNEILRFIYQYGMGLRTGQGFGYLEVEDGEA